MRRAHLHRAAQLTTRPYRFLRITCRRRTPLPPIPFPFSGYSVSKEGTKIRAEIKDTIRLMMITRIKSVRFIFSLSGRSRTISRAAMVVAVAKTIDGKTLWSRQRV